MSHINNEKIRQLSLYGILVFLAIFLFLQLASFLPAFLGAITFYIVMRPLINRLIRKGWKKGMAATFLILVSFILVLLPICFFVNVLYTKIDYAIANSNQVIMAAKAFVAQMEAKYHITLISNAHIESAGLQIAQTIPLMLNATFNILVTIVVLYFILYFMLVNGNEMENWLRQYIPFKNENVDLIGLELKTLVLSNAFGIPITALLQGIIGVIGYWLLGVSDLPFWFVVTCITAIIPMVGSSIAFVSIALLFFGAGDITRGVLLLAYGMCIMYVLDSVFRIAIQKRMGNVHPLITTFGVIIGIRLFGFIGLIFGPIIISLFILLVKLYLNEFSQPEGGNE